jgi:predicted Fe-Mo cluster-binding NifX family protein
MRVCVPVTVDGQVDARWGRARRLAVAQVDAGLIMDWREFDVGWDVLRAQGTDGAHHARVARFLRDHEVEAVIASHMGAPMRRMLDTMELRVLPAAAGDARAVVAAAGQ